jgi:hypothetical protein
MIDRKPPNILFITVSARLQLSSIEQGEVDHRNDARSRITCRITKGVELLEVDILHAGLFPKFTPGSLLQCFIDVHKATWYRPHTLIRPGIAIDQQDLEALLTQTHHHDVYRD